MPRSLAASCRAAGWWGLEPSDTRSWRHALHYSPRGKTCHVLVLGGQLRPRGGALEMVPKLAAHPRPRYLGAHGFRAVLTSFLGRTALRREVSDGTNFCKRFDDEVKQFLDGVRLRRACRQPRLSAGGACRLKDDTLVPLCLRHAIQGDRRIEGMEKAIHSCF